MEKFEKSFLKKEYERIKESFQNKDYFKVIDLSFKLFNINLKDRTDHLNYSEVLSILYYCGHAFRLTNQFEKAEIQFRLILEKFPNDCRAIKGLAEVANQQKNWEKAVKYSICLQKIRPDMWQGYWWSGHAYKNLKEYERAEEYFRLMTEKFPQMHHGLEGMINVAQQQKNWEKVVSRSYQFRESFPNLWHSYWFAGHAFKNLSEYEEAKNEFQLLQKISPKTHYGLEGLINIYQCEKDWKSATKYSELLIELFPELSVSYALLITSLKGNDQIDKAIYYAKLFAKKFPDLELACRYLTVIMCQNFDFDKAYPYYNNYCRKFEDSNNISHVIYLKISLGMYEDALNYYKLQIANQNIELSYDLLMQLAKINQCLYNSNETIKYWNFYREKWIKFENSVTYSFRSNSISGKKSLDVLIHEKISQNLNEEARDLFNVGFPKLDEIDVLRFSSWFSYLNAKSDIANINQSVVQDTIQSLWVGSDLDIVQQLCLASYLYHGHEVCLYVYQDLKNIPKGVVVKDANEILPEKDIFYSHGSLAHFSDWFRWQMIFDKSGYWVDMDEVCLKPFNFSDDYVFGYESYAVANAVLKFPSHHYLAELMVFMSQNPNHILPWDTKHDIKRKQNRIKKNLGREHTLWGEASGPTGLTKALFYFGLDGFIKPYYYFYGLNATQIRRMLLDNNFDECIFENMYAIHIWKDAFIKNIDNSMFDYLIKKYQDFI